MQIVILIQSIFLNIKTKQALFLKKKKSNMLVPWFLFIHIDGDIDELELEHKNGDK